ncbi:MAG: hypothetical protein AAGD32_16630 [Planctomycetota bacterium]
MAGITDTANDTGYDQTVEKICRVCKRDLRGHRRIRDGDEYICPTCDKLEREGQLEGLPCAECGRMISPTSLKRYGDISICPKCYTEHQRDTKKRPRKIADHTWKIEEKRNVLILAGIAAVLLVFMLIGWMLT